MVPVMRKGILDNVLETGEADMDILVRLSGSISFAQFWHLTGYTLW